MTTITEPSTRTEPHPPTDARGSWPARWWRGRPDDPAWVRPGLLLLLLTALVLYVYDLGASGWANSFYAAAAQAGGDDWSAWFFGASDAAGSITVDKPPASLWVMGLSVRLFGLSSWSLLVPEALMGVASVGVLYLTVRRITRSPGAGLLAGAALMLTPVAALMFRFDNPDALLVLLLTGAVWATVAAIGATGDNGQAGAPRARRLLVLAGALVGLAFLTKMMQAFLVLPGLVVAYAVAADLPVWQRVRHLLAACVAMIVSAGWYVAVVELWPSGSRPYVGGSQHDSFLELVLGYNGLGRLTGDETGSVGAGGMWGSTGVWRLLDSENGGQIGWLLPTALLLLVVGLWSRGRRPRTDLPRAGLLALGGWLVVTALTFSFMQGIFHAYYSVALAPAVAGTTAVGAVELWRRRRTFAGALLLALACALTAGVSFALLGRSPDFVPWLRWAVLLGGLAVATLLGLTAFLGARARVAVVVASLIVGTAGPAAYTIETVTTPHSGSIVSAGPSGASSGPGGMPGGGMPQGMTPPNGANLPTPPTGGRPSRGGAMSGLLDSTTPSAAVTARLTADADSYTWVAATVGAQNAAGYQLATERSVMPIGGFNGTDPSPTLAEFKAYVARGEIHWFIASSGGGPGGAAGGGGAISTWVSRHFHATTVDGVTMYDLSDGVSA